MAKQDEKRTGGDEENKDKNHSTKPKSTDQKHKLGAVSIFFSGKPIYIHFRVGFTEGSIGRGGI
jgi:hypothetical protein